MDTPALAELVRVATCDVFSTMLSLELEAAAPFENARPLCRSDVTAMIGIAGDQQGFVSIHCTQRQAQEFTARLLGAEPESVTDPEAIIDAVGELVNMVAGTMKCRYARRGTLQISLPTVILQSATRVKAPPSLVVGFDGAAGSFRIEVMLADPPR